MPDRLGTCGHRVNPHSKTGLCRPCWLTANRNPNLGVKAPCSGCSRPTRQESGLCRACERYGASADHTDEALTGGRWVTVDGIQHYRPWTDAECIERSRRALAALPPPSEFTERQDARRRLRALVDDLHPARGAA